MGHGTSWCPRNPAHTPLRQLLAVVVASVVAAVTASGIAPSGPAAAAPVAASSYSDGVFSQAAPRFCDRTGVYTPSNRIRTQIVRHSDGWSNTINSRYRKWVHCRAHQMTATMWCTTERVDGMSGICITPEPRAAGESPCARPRLDVRSVYYPRTGRLAITCVNEAGSGSTRSAAAGGPDARATVVTRTDPRGDVSPARLDMLRTQVRFGDRLTVRTGFAALRRGTGYLAFVDPGRRGGGLFRLDVQVRRDLRTTGRLLWHAAGAPAGRFVEVRCPGLRTSSDMSAATLRVSAPARCLSSRTRLGGGVRMDLNSFALPIGPAGGDLLPDHPRATFWVPRP